MVTYTHTNHIPLILFSAYTQYKTPCNVHQYILTLSLLAMVHIVKNRHKWQRILYLMHMHDKALLVLDQQSTSSNITYYRPEIIYRNLRNLWWSNICDIEPERY